jgi:hypothetical protein
MLTSTRTLSFNRLIAIFYRYYIQSVHRRHRCYPYWSLRHRCHHSHRCHVDTLLAASILLRLNLYCQRMQAIARPCKGEDQLTDYHRTDCILSRLLFYLSTSATDLLTVVNTLIRHDVGREEIQHHRYVLPLTSFKK